MIRRAAIVGLLLLHTVPASAQTADPIASAWAEFRKDVLTETAGVFWIAAEIAILFFLGVAVRVFSERPLSSSIQLTSREKRNAGFALATILVLVCFVYGRYAIVAPLPIAFTEIAASGDKIGESAKNAYFLRAHLHLGLWCGAVAAWIALEIAIVVQGIRVFHRLRALVRETRA